MRIGTLFPVAVLAASLGAPDVTLAAQALIPQPYPSTVGHGAPLDPEPQGSGGPQTIMRDPYPQILGDNSQGNPPIARRHGHQTLVPSFHQRRYRVDRP